MYRSAFKRRSGFTLIELLIVIGIIGTLASVTIIAINPNKQLNAAKDAGRLSAMQALRNSISQYIVDNGAPPTGVTALAWTPVCKQGVTGDSSCISLDSALIPKYLAGIPQDPSETNANYSGYLVGMTNGRPFVSTPYYGKITSGLVGWWRFDENSGTVAADMSGNGNTATLVGSPSWVSGRVANALQFNGTSNYAVVPNSTSLTIANAITVMAWVKGPAAGVWQKVVGKGPDATEEYGLYFKPGSGWCHIEAGISGGQRLMESGTIADNTWHQCVFTYDGTTMTLYVDGVVTASLAQTGVINTSAESVSIGAEKTSTSQTYYTNAAIDDVRIYNRALSASEIQQIYAGNG